jgi:hypothetical protein
MFARQLGSLGPLATMVEAMESDKSRNRAGRQPDRRANSNSPLNSVNECFYAISRQQSPKALEFIRGGAALIDIIDGAGAQE